MVNYLDSRRIMGTTAERSSIPTPATAGGWVELGRTTGTAPSVGSLADKRYYMVLYDLHPDGGTADVSSRLNSDTGTNYAVRYAVDGGADGTLTSVGSGLGVGGYAVSRSTPYFGVGYLSNLSSKEKLWISHSVNQNTAGAANAPLERQEGTSKWANTSNAVNTIEAHSSGTAYTSGSEVVVLGWDPSDTHSTNFWEELADVTLGSVGDQLSTGSFSAKKYLWYQAFIKKNATASNFAEHSINGITSGNTWARRLSSNGGADGTATSQNTINTTDSGAGGYFLNGFVINVSGNEKLFIEHVVQNTTAGAGTAPNRKEAVLKCTTSAQITQLTISGATNGYEAGSFIKVWGSN